jgi:hypothetical protein
MTSNFPSRPSAGRAFTRFNLILPLLLACAGCHARKTYPDPNPGWHSGDFTVIYGRLQRVTTPTTQPDLPPPPAVWTIRFGQSNAVYNGELALTPAERFIGFSGGENVEIHGHLLTEATNDAFSGRWYVVDSIRMWYEHQ